MRSIVLVTVLSLFVLTSIELSFVFYQRKSTGFTDSASAVLQLAAICTVLAVVYTTNTKYRDATVVTARFLLWHGGLKRTPVVVMALNYPRSLV